MKNRLKVFFVLDDTIFFTPKMLNDILSNKKYEWCGLAISTKDNLFPYMMKNILKVGLISAIKIGIVKYSLIFYSKFITPLTKFPVTLKDVAKCYCIKYIYTDNVNERGILNHIKVLKPDVIVSSTTQIFKKELLTIPKIGCINIHPALLPKYGGILPVFQAIAHGEKEIGVTIHFMNESIDGGDIIIQERIPINKNETLFGLYEKCFKLSSELVIKSLEILERGKIKRKKQGKSKKSYFSFPNNEQWKMFIKNGGRFI